MPLIGAGALDVFQSAAGIWTDGVYFSEVIGCQDAAAACPGYNSNGPLEAPVWASLAGPTSSRVLPLRVQTTRGGSAHPRATLADPGRPPPFSNLDLGAGLVPANLETMTGTPPAGRPEYFLSMSDLPGTAATPLGDGLMDIWEYHVDWSNPANSWVGQSASNQTDFQVATPTYGVPDLATGLIASDGPSFADMLNSNFDYILPKPQYTNFGGVESIWTAHATAVHRHGSHSKEPTDHRT